MTMKQRSKAARYVNGYRLLHKPEHPSSYESKNWDGYVYEHILVAEEFIGRKLQSDEVVHHLDGNRLNNRVENLIVMLRSQHTKLHAWLDKGAPFSKESGCNRVNSEESKEVKVCELCGTCLQAKQKRFCSDECYRASGAQCKVDRPDAETLADDIQKMSWCAIGRKYGVSDNAVRKWAKKYKLL